MIGSIGSRLISSRPDDRAAPPSPAPFAHLTTHHSTIQIAMIWPTRVLRTIRRHGMLPRGGRVLCRAVWRRRLRRAAARAARAAGARRARRSPAPRTSTTAFAVRTRIATRSSAGRSPRRSACRSRRTRRRSRRRRARRSARSRTRRAPRDTRSSPKRRRVSPRSRSQSATRVDDQAETFLLRLMRGAGTRGLGGIRPRAGLVVRPLHRRTREATQGVCGRTGPGTSART